jgi:RNA polymerase sigma-70 factor (ECF subfamily)
VTSDDRDFRLHTVTNTELLDGLRHADNRIVWQQFVERYRPMIERYAMRFGLVAADAQDAAQQTLIEFCTAYQAGKYDREQGRLRSWLFGIARNQMRNLRRRSRRHERQVVDDTSATGFFGRVADDDELEKAWDEEWRQSVLQQCLEEVRRDVDAKSVEAFELFAWRGLSAQEVADRLGMTPNAVFIAKHRILRRIRALAQQMEHIW